MEFAINYVLYVIVVVLDVITIHFNKCNVKSSVNLLVTTWWPLGQLGDTWYPTSPLKRVPLSKPEYLQGWILRYQGVSQRLDRVHRDLNDLTDLWSWGTWGKRKRGGQRYLPEQNFKTVFFFHISPLDHYCPATSTEDSSVYAILGRIVDLQKDRFCRFVKFCQHDF